MYLLKSPNQKDHFGIVLFFCFIILMFVLDLLVKTVFPVFTTNLMSNAIISYRELAWVTYVVQVAFISLLAHYKRNLSVIIYLFLFLLNGVSYFIWFGYLSTMTIEFFLLVNTFWFIFSLFFLLASNNATAFVEFGNVIRRDEMVVFGLVVVIALGISFNYGNFRFVLSFDNVYEYRMSLSMPTIIGYVFRFTSGVFVPYFFIRFVMAKKIMCSIITLVLAILLFSVDGLKTNIVLYLVLLGIYFLFNMVKQKQKPPIYIALLFVIILSFFLLLNYWGYQKTKEYYFLDESYRVLMIPSLISNNYFNFIVDREPLLLRESIFSWFCESPYQESINYLVTDVVTKYGRAVANTGMVGDAYANFKTFGILLYPIMYGSVIWFWQKINHNEINPRTIGIGFILIWNAINISFFTWLLTGGVFVYCLLTLYFRSNKIKHKREEIW